MIELIIVVCSLEYSGREGRYVNRCANTSIVTFEDLDRCETFITSKSNGKRWGNDFVVAYCQPKKLERGK